MPVQQTTQAISVDKMRMFTLACYFLHGVSAATGGISSIVVVIINYKRKKEALGTPYQGHHEKMITTFWGGLIGAFFILAVMILSPVLIFWVPFIGILIMPMTIFLLVWVMYRLVTGGLKAYNAEPLL